MKTWPFAIVALASFFFAGCRTDPAITLLERQNRMLEDEVYRLRGLLDDCSGGCGENWIDSEMVCSTPIGSDEDRDFGVREHKRRNKKSRSPQSVAPPVVEMPGEAQPPGEVPETFKHPAGSTIHNGQLKHPAGSTIHNGQLKHPAGSSIPDWQLKHPADSTAPNGHEMLETPGNLEGPAVPNMPDAKGIEGSSTTNTSFVHPAAGYEFIATGESELVRQLFLNRMYTRGYNADGQPGDNGVVVVLDPRDAKGRRLEAAAEVSVALLDPAKNGEEARVARWDFSAEETARCFRDNGTERGMYLQCPWPANPPEHKRLHLFVRYTTSDGRKLQVDQPIEISLPNEIANWIPAPTREQAETVSYAGNVTSYQSDVAARQDEQSLRSDYSSQTGKRSTRVDPDLRRAKLKRPRWSPER
ncbi:MAG: hypothetical protein ACWGMZ_10905 [Thermoguttaceae bacterium]